MQTKKSLLLRILGLVERLGNRLPDPTSLFVILTVGVLLISKLLGSMGSFVKHPATQQEVFVQDLLQAKFIQKMFTDAVSNFSLFPPLGLVLVIMIGIGVAENSGLITAALRSFIQRIPSPLLSFALIFGGIQSNLASDAGYVVYIPLGALIFHQAGRHPLAGLAAAFAGVSAGFSANLMVTSLDPLLAGLTEKAAQIVKPDAVVNATANYYFMLVSTFILSLIGTFVNWKMVEPRLGQWKAENAESEIPAPHALNQQERRALRLSLIAMALFAIATFSVALPQGSLFRDAAGTLNPFFQSLVPLLMILFLLGGSIYAIVSRRVRNDKDLVKLANTSLSGMGGYIVMVFFAAQFLAYFNWSNLGVFTAVKGAEFLQNMGFVGWPLIVVFIFVSGFLNLFMGSASAKWAIMAPVFVPMLMMVGQPPELVQAAYRIGDSSTNILCPLLPYYPLILIAARRYDRHVGIGSLVAIMLPYALTFLISWSLLLVIWAGLLGLPLGS